MVNLSRALIACAGAQDVAWKDLQCFRWFPYELDTENGGMVPPYEERDDMRRCNGDWHIVFVAKTQAS